jgi:hypothetical protein
MGPARRTDNVPSLTLPAAMDPMSRPDPMVGGTLMDVDKAIAQLSAAGIELTDRRRNVSDDGWSLSFSNGAELEVYDNGQVRMQGKNVDAVARILDLPAAPGGAS